MVEHKPRRNASKGIPLITVLPFVSTLRITTGYVTDVLPRGTHLPVLLKATDDFREFGFRVITLRDG